MQYTHLFRKFRIQNLTQTFIINFLTSACNKNICNLEGVINEHIYMLQ
jgi:hypothetical protein